MSHNLSKTTEVLLEIIGLSYEEFMQMDDDEIQAYVEHRIGKKVTWPKGAKVDGLPICTMEEINRKIDEM